MTAVDLPLLRTSERKDFKRCPQRWWWSWREGLEPLKQSTPLWFGTGIHYALEHWYIPGAQRGVDPRDSWKVFIDGQIAAVKVEMLSGDRPEGSDSVFMDAEELGIDILTNYLDTYGDDSEWEILAVEQPFQVKIAHPDNPAVPIILYLGTFDLVARHRETGKLWLWDHKTAKQIKVDHLSLDDQAGSYWALATHVLGHQGLIPKNEGLAGIMYNFIMKSPKDERPTDEKGRARNKPIKQDYIDVLFSHYLNTEPPSFTDGWDVKAKKMKVAELAELAEDAKVTVLGAVSEKQPSIRLLRHPVNRTKKERKSQIERIGEEALIMDYFREQKLPLYKNPTPDCKWDCSFFNMCQIDELQGDVDEFKDVAFRVRDPYGAHR